MVLAERLVLSLSKVDFDPSIVVGWRSIRSAFVGFVHVVVKSFVRRRKWLTSVKRRLFYVSVQAFQSRQLKIVPTVG